MVLVLLHPVTIIASSYHDSCPLYLLVSNCKNVKQKYSPLCSEISGELEAQFM